jgi:hypothetical protein
MADPMTGEGISKDEKVDVEVGDLRNGITNADTRTCSSHLDEKILETEDATDKATSLLDKDTEAMTNGEDVVNTVESVMESGVTMAVGPCGFGDINICRLKKISTSGVCYLNFLTFRITLVLT